MKASRLHLILLSFLFSLLPALAGEYRVSPAENDQGPGTGARPSRTIPRAALPARPGDVVVVHRGFHLEKASPAGA